MFNNFIIDYTKLINLFKYDSSDPLLFGTSLFLFLFGALLVVYTLLSKYKSARTFLLILFSLYFYYKASGIYFLTLVGSAVLNFYGGKVIFSSSGIKRKALFIIVILLNLGLLGYFKYTNFLLTILNDFSAGNFQPLKIFLPIGISFFTFKALSYVIDVHMEMMEPTNSFKDFCLYIFFFPNLLAGPIDRASAFIPQINEERFISKEDIGKALLLIISGLVKKFVIADYISLNFIDRVFEFPQRFTGVENLLAVYGYALQIFCDFSGYSDLAIGIGLLLGYRLMDNFNSPYKATSVTDFWRRWHISLSSWLLDYLFRPLQMKFRNFRNFGNVIALIITFVLCGLWHGASWAFVLWGLLHGFYMSIGVLTKNLRTAVYSKLKLDKSKIFKIVQVFLTFNLIAFSFILFRASDMDNAYAVIKQIWNYFHPEVFPQFVVGFQNIFILMVAGYLFHFLPIKVETKTREILANTPLVLQALLLAVVIYFVGQVKSADLQPFIYFQF